MEYDYEKLLDKGRSQLPESVLKIERFEVPKVKGHIQGNKTIVSNYLQICNVLRREPEHLLKYLQRELATPALIDDSRLVLGRKISSSSINGKIQQYTDTFVLCPECKKPDTKLLKEDKFLLIKCTACGAKHTVKTKI